MNWWVKLLPLVVFLALAGFLAKGLTLDPSELPSPLIDKPAPVFEAPRLSADNESFNSQSMAGQVWVLNIWASWCAPCVQEHPYLVALADERDTPLVGLNYKDQPDDALQWLGRLGNPFTHLLDDQNGDVGLDWGVYGVPETFIIDAAGRVRYKHVGPLDEVTMRDTFIPILDQLENGGA